ncbi:MAG: ATP-binding domain-containing protein, partial [Clostridiales bacterium]|nr:ATP-binding domain-containing protein [Clostridiales bacterium]
DILAYLKTIDNGKDDVAVKRIINIPKRGIGATTILRVQEYAQERNISFFEALQEANQIMAIGKSYVKLEPFVTMIQVFRSKAEYLGIEELIRDILESTGYSKELEESDDEEAADRIENIEELISKGVSYSESVEQPNLSQFLEEVALVADIDRVDGDDNRVMLMTLHSAKGLEFSNVYLTGMEDGLFPSYMTINAADPMEVEEERRLAYVGITRAKEDLTIYCAKARMIHGETQYNPVSRFVKEIPEELLDHKLPSSRSRDFVEYEDNSYERSAFRAAPFGGSYGGGLGSNNASSDKRPKAILKKPETAMESRPFIAQGIGSLSGLNGVTKGASLSGGTPDYDTGDRVSHVKYGAGVVKAIEPGPRDYQVTVEFDQCGVKIMYAAFAKLQKI